MEQYIRSELLNRFEFQNYGHALEILSEAFPEEWADIQDCLASLKISVSDLTEAGGNETAIPKKFDDVLYPRGWREIRISGDLLVKLYPRGNVAFDLEWNSKDQTFDRDLMAMRTYFDCGLIEVGIIITRAGELNDIFSGLDIRKKYGASTTWMGKLEQRLKSRRNGGCPVLAIGIKKPCVEGYE